MRAGVLVMLGVTVLALAPTAAARPPLQDRRTCLHPPPRGGAVKAVGIVMASRVFFGRGDLCYTPIQTVLDAFGAQFPTGVVTTSG